MNVSCISVPPVDKLLIKWWTKRAFAGRCQADSDRERRSGHQRALGRILGAPLPAPCLAPRLFLLPPRGAQRRADGPHFQPPLTPPKQVSGASTRRCSADTARRRSTASTSSSESRRSSLDDSFSNFDHLFFSPKAQRRRHKARLEGVVDEIHTMLVLDHPALMRLREHFVGAVRFPAVAP